MSYQIEVTDTFSGEPNFCWVRRGKTRAKTRRGKIEAAKRVAGWHGWCRVKVDDCGGDLTIRPVDTSGICQIAFVTWTDDET